MALPIPRRSRRRRWSRATVAVLGTAGALLIALLIEQVFAPLLVALAEETHQVTTGMEAERTRRAGEFHAGLIGRPVAFAIVAGMAAGNKVFPCRFAGA